MNYIPLYLVFCLKNPQVFYALISVLYDRIGEWGDDGNPAIDPLEGIYVPNEIEAKEETVLVARIDVKQENEVKEGCENHNIERMEVQMSQGGKNVEKIISMESENLLLQLEEIQNQPTSCIASNSMDIVKIETDPLKLSNESHGNAFTILNSFSVPAKAFGKERVHQCDICSKIFLNVHQLSLHETVIHYGGHKARECNVCGETFPSPSWLVEHMKLHSKEKPYKCNVCGKAYAQERVFKAHEKLHATEVKEIKCQFCELQLKNLMHKKLHSEKRPYKCNVCLEGFDCSGLLGKHSKTHIS